MEKILQIDDNKTLKLNNNIGWAMAYRDQFGVDILPTMLPLLASALDIMAGVLNATGKTDDVTLEDIAKLADGEALIDAVMHLGGFELADLINITWAMAKAADDSTPEPREWIKQFDNFPLDVIAPAVFGMIFSGMVSSKNQKRLEGVRERLQPMKK